MDALTLLHQDHQAVSALLDEANDCEPGDGRLDSLAVEIERALTVHAAIEEKYFYPQLRKRSDETDEIVDVFEAYTEHALLKTLIALLEKKRQPDEQFKAELQVLGESAKHHVHEEESTIFSLAKELMDRDELETLGEKMAAAKERMLADMPRTGPAKERGSTKGTVAGKVASPKPSRR